MPQRPIRPKRSSLANRAIDAAPDGSGPRVSVVIPTHNRSHLVTRAIESVLAQTYRGFELVVVDDASSDNTADVVGRIDDPRLRYVRLPKNRGESGAQNAGIAEARGEWVAFLDDDDEWLPGKLECQLARVDELADAQIGAVLCRCSVRTEDGIRAPQRRGELPEGEITDNLLAHKQLMTPSVYMAKRSALLAAGGFDETMRWAQDQDLWLRLSQAGCHFAVVPQPLVIYNGEAGPNRMSLDCVTQLRGVVTMARRWGPLMRERLGEAEYERWWANWSKRLRRHHRKFVRRLERRGDRGAAWRYVRGMTPALPWGVWFVARALLVAAFGRLPYRAGRAAKALAGRRSPPELTDAVDVALPAESKK